MSNTMLVRLKPWDPKKGYHLRTMMTPDGKKYEGERGWYEVSTVVADNLRQYRQVQEDPESHDAFDVCTHDEALALDKRPLRTERAPAENPVRQHSISREGVRTSTDRGDMTTRDIRGGGVPDLDGSEDGWDKATGGEPSAPAVPAAPRVVTPTGPRARPRAAAAHAPAKADHRTMVKKEAIPSPKSLSDAQKKALEDLDVDASDAS